VSNCHGGGVAAPPPPPPPPSPPPPPPITTPPVATVLVYYLLHERKHLDENIRILRQFKINVLYYIHKVWIWGILQSDWFSTSRILAHILLVEKNKMAAHTEFPTFCERENGKLFAFIAFTRLKTQWKKLPQIVYRLANEFLKFKMVKNIYFWKNNGRKSEDKNINKIEKYWKYPKSKVCEFRPCVYNKTVIPLTLVEYER
jgi:hypothetical protein